MWAEAEAKEKAKIDSIFAEDGGRSKVVAAVRSRAWSKTKAKEKSEIDRVAAQASEKANAEAEERESLTVRLR